MAAHADPHWKWCVQAGVSATSTLRVDQTDYGDGYTYRLTRGLNPRQQSVSISAPFTSMDELGAMDAFLEANGTRGFWFTAPGWPQDDPTYDIFVYADSWSSTIVDKNNAGQIVGTLQATFVRCFNPQPVYPPTLRGEA
jgi:phage-related protein